MKRITIGYIKREVNTYSFSINLGKSLAELNGEFDVIEKDDKRSPSENYNQMIDECKTPYLVLCHQDIRFAPELLERIDETISIVPDFGVIGLVGQHRYGQQSTNPHQVIEIDTLDSCLIMIKTENAPRFDTKIFNEYHLYVEDYCANFNRVLGKKNYVIKWDPSRWFHYGETFRITGGAWGNYMVYKRKLSEKWPGVITT